MTTTYARRTRRTSKPRREVSETSLPTNEDGKLDLAAVLVAALTVPGKMSGAYSRFHKYSFMNMVLVFMQTGKIEPMGTFNKWKSLGRTIISGPGSALFVNHPKPVYKRDDSGNVVTDDNGKPVIAYVRFEPKPTVFQLFQTDGPDLEFPATPDWDRAQALEALDITEVAFSHHDGNTQGYSVGHEFALNPVAVAPFKTTIHEWAHIILGHTTPDELPNYQSHRGVSEFQAEAVALLVCRELAVESFDESASRAYIQHWLGSRSTDYLNHDDEIGDAVLVDDSTVRAIFSATDKILVAGRKRHFDKLAADEQTA